jgi:predicted dehydrogenase
VTESAVRVGPVRVGLVGAGPWAQMVHAPMLAAHPSIELVGVWSRRRDAAASLAAAHGTEACDSVDALLDRCDAVAFAVPPDVQAPLAITAAGAGKALLLEKPLALDLATAEQLADAVAAASVPTQVVLSYRYSDAVRAFLADVSAHRVIGGRAHFISGAALGGPFATPWRIEHGGLYDLGPHVLDSLDAALGTITDLTAHGSSTGWLGLTCRHETGAVSEASISMQCPMDGFDAGVSVATDAGLFEVDFAAAITPAVFERVADEFVATVRGTPHPLDVHRGLHLQRLVDQAQRTLA